jgi:hypothetical protein
MATWTVFPLDVSCGACSRVIPAGEPVQLLTSRQLKRCQDDAVGPVDWQELDLERARLEMERAREAEQSQAAQSRGGAVVRHQRPTKSFQRVSDMKLPFDPRAAQFHDA